jgi:hypothetical protein
MSRCSDRRDLSELDPVTFFIVTELMWAEREAEAKVPVRMPEPAQPIREDALAQVA